MLSDDVEGRGVEKVYVEGYSYRTDADKLVKAFRMIVISVFAKYR